jgi:hypothetical protein
MPGSMPKASSRSLAALTAGSAFAVVVTIAHLLAARILTMLWSSTEML